MISLRALAQEATRNTMGVGGRNLQPSRNVQEERQTYSAGLQQTPMRYSTLIPAPSFTVPVQKQPPPMLSNYRRTSQPTSNLNQLQVFQVSELLPQISSFRGQLAECFRSAVVYCFLLVLVPLGYFLGLKLSFELTLLLIFQQYVKILSPNIQKNGAVFYPTLFLFMLTFVTDFASDSKTYTLAELSYCLPAACFLVYFKWSELTTNEIRLYSEAYGILGVAWLSIRKTFIEIKSFAFLRGLLVTFVFCVLAALSLASTNLDNLNLSLLLKLLLCHVVIVYAANVFNEVDVWVDITDNTAARYNNDLIMSFWILRLEDPSYIHVIPSLTQYQNRAIKHINRLLLKQKGLMHETIERNGFGQRRYWDILVKFASYRLHEMNKILNEGSDYIFRTKGIILGNKSLLQDVFIYPRKLITLLVVKWQVKLVAEELASTLPIFDSVVKAIFHSRRGIEQNPLTDPYLSSQLASILESCLKIYECEYHNEPMLRTYAVYCFSLMEFLNGKDPLLTGLQRTLDDYLSKVQPNKKSQ